MNTDNEVVQLCIEGTRAEFQGRQEDARRLYWQAWQAAQDDYEACIAAHYVARFAENDTDRLHWNQVALDRAEAVLDDRVKAFYPSLYLNLGQSHEILGNQAEARRYYDLAVSLGYPHFSNAGQP